MGIWSPRKPAFSQTSSIPSYFEHLSLFLYDLERLSSVETCLQVEIWKRLRCILGGGGNLRKGRDETQICPPPDENMSEDSYLLRGITCYYWLIIRWAVVGQALVALPEMRLKNKNPPGHKSFIWFGPKKKFIKEDHRIFYGFPPSGKKVVLRVQWKCHFKLCMMSVAEQFLSVIITFYMMFYCAPLPGSSATLSKLPNGSASVCWSAVLQENSKSKNSIYKEFIGWSLYF